MSDPISRQQVVRNLLTLIVARPDFPVFAEHIQELMHCAEDDETSFRYLTNLILKDFSLTLKVLRTANSPYYNRSGRPILTVTHAVALLGMDAIRDLAGSMLLFHHYRAFSPGLKELMLLSLLTASHAREVADRMRYPRLEEAYLCGMFRNLGEVLVASYLPREYAAILLEMKERSVTERDACLRILRCTFEDLAVAAASHWKMPNRVAQCIRATEPRLGKTMYRENELLEAVTSFSHGLTTAIYRRAPEEGRARLNKLLDTHGPILSLRRDEIQEITQAAISDTKTTFEVLQVPLDDLRLRKQTEDAVAYLQEEAQAKEAPVQDLPAGERLLEALTAEVVSLVNSSDEFELTSAILMILEAMYRGAPFHRVVFSLVTPDHEHVQGRLGLGEGVDSLVEQFHFPLSKAAGPIAASILAKQDLWVWTDRYEDSELVKITGAPCFGIYPVIVENVVAGCFYFDRLTPVAPLNERVAGLVGKLRDVAAVAILKKRD